MRIMRIRNAFALIGLVAGLLACQAAFAAEAAFRIGGAVENPGEWTVARISKELSRDVQSVRYTMKDEQHTAKCVPLLALIEAARPRIDPQRKNHRVGFAVVLRARDGYAVTFSLAELAPDIGDRKVWLALEVDGKPLPEQEGPIRLIVPDEGKGHYRRWLFGITSITVVDGAKVSEPAR